jgi:hypothetical protein
MAMYGQVPLLEDGSIKAEPMFYPSGLVVDVIKGRAILYNHENHPQHSNVWGLSCSNPLIVHFHCSNANRHQYKTECLKLEKVITKGWNYQIVRIYAFLRFTTPEQTKTFLKTIFRPLYRIMFGVRSIHQSERIVE